MINNNNINKITIGRGYPVDLQQGDEEDVDGNSGENVSWCGNGGLLKSSIRAYRRMMSKGESTDWKSYFGGGGILEKI